MTTLDTIALWLAALFIGYVFIGADLAVVHTAADSGQAFFAQAKSSLDITIVEDTWGAVRDLMQTGHDALNEGAAGMMSETQ